MIEAVIAEYSFYQCWELRSCGERDQACWSNTP
ncbi:hypothetical protein sync_2688 [Synechococcus sp. CC9311]|nr:hypothetical protein sync_2688 [Synechococcus sp. CC9311]